MIGVATMADLSTLAGVLEGPSYSLRSFDFSSLVSTGTVFGSVFLYLFLGIGKALVKLRIRS